MQRYRVYVPIDRQHALGEKHSLPNRAQGAALFADVSGFTPLTEALVREFGPQRGAEELTRYLNLVYDALIDCLHSYGAAVISFAGDAITCWFDGDDGLRAAACALHMQEAMQPFSTITISAGRAGGLPVSLAIKIAIASGPVRRFVVGDPKIQLIDVLAGSTLYHLAAAEHNANRGEVILDPATVRLLQDRVVMAERRLSPDSEAQCGVLQGLLAQPKFQIITNLPDEAFAEEDLAPWILPPVYQRLRQGQGEFLAELRPAIVLFLNFTGIDFDADEDAGEKLNAYVGWVQQELGRYEGYVLQLTVGDKGNYLYGAFGAPIAHEDDSVRAISAALNLLQLPPHLSYIQGIRIGISQGRLRTGAYGGSQRRTYGVIGRDVNRAARLMEAAEPGQILTNETVKQSARQAFRWDPAERSIRVKGIGEPIKVYSPLGLQPRQALRLQSANYALPMVGREPELKLLEQKIDLARQGHGQIVGITGESGVGKSRLIYEAVTGAISEGFTYYGGECQSYTIESSYWPWQPVWRSLFSVEDSQPVAEQIAALGEQLEAIDPGLLPRLPLLKTALGMPIPENAVTRTLDAKIRKSSLEALLTDCLRAFARREPLLIVLEDCQWLDALSHDLAEVLGRATADLPIMFILAYRPLELERLREARVSRLPNFAELSLEKFSRDETGRLIALKLQQYGVDEALFSPALVERIVAAAEGNPFYVEELLNYIHDRGLDQLRQQEDSASLDLPTSLHSLILTRVDQLTEKQQITLKVASVIGRLFRAALLWGMYPDLGQPEQVIADLDLLSQLHITAKSPAEPEQTYFFQQLLTQQVAYENLPYATRAVLHQQLAGYLEKNVGESLDRYVDLLAFHYLKGENWPKALEYNLSAARRDERAYANNAAQVACLNALSAAEHIPEDTAQQQLECYQILGNVRMLLGQYDAAVDSYLHAKQIAEAQPASVEKVSRLAHLCHQLSATYERKSDFDRAFEWLNTGLALAGHDSRSLETSRIYLLGSGLYRRQGKQEEAEAWCQRSLEISQHIPTREGRQIVAQAYYNLGNSHSHRGLPQQGINYCLESLKIFEQIGDVSGQTHAYNNLGITYSDLGDLARSEQAYTRGLELTQKIGDIQQAGFFANNVGIVYLNQGEWEKAADSFKRSNAIWKQLGAGLPDAVTLSNAAQVDLFRGRLDSARDKLSESDRIFRHLNVEDYLSELERRWGEYYLRAGDTASALTHVHRSLDFAVVQKGRLDEGLAYRALGEILCASSDRAGSREMLGNAQAIFAELNNEYEMARTRLMLGQLDLVCGDGEAARHEFAQAQATFERLGAKAYAAQASALAA